jgi:diguanylate cyclase (GGDEF)-like protein
MQQTDWLAVLPEAISRQIRTAYVPAHVKRLFSYLPQPVTLSGVLSETLPRGAAQLCKLSLLSSRLFPGELLVSHETRLALSVHPRSVQLSSELEDDLTVVTQRALRELFSLDDLFLALEDFSFQSSTLEVLQRLMQEMLSAKDIDRLCYLMLLGATSGEALGFHRAIFFSFDESTQTLQGSKAIGPSNKAEAHRIWEELEFLDTTIEHLASESSQQSIDVHLQQKIAALSLAASEVSAVLTSSGPVQLAPSEQPASLAALEIDSPFLLAPLRTRQRLLGLLLVDHIVTGATASPQQQLLLRLFLEQTTLLWENLLLMRRLEGLASYDGLTGVLTRREFDARFAAELVIAKEQQTPCSLLMIDLDSFKQINDTLGHAAGDDVLRQVGALLRRELRKNDLVGRFGGDEFVLFLPQVNAQGLSLIASRLLRALTDANIMTSIGGASFPEGCASPDDLFQCADQNLYRAKHAGKNQLVIG